jgi:hypothetical protein
MSHSTEDDEPIRYYEWMLWKLKKEREKESEVR